MKNISRKKQTEKLPRNNVVQFPRNRQKILPATERVMIPKKADADDFATFTAKGVWLKGLGIYDGDTIVCRKGFDFSELLQNSLVVLEIGGDLFPRMVRFNDNGTITTFSPQPDIQPQTYYESEVKFLGLAVSIQRQIHFSEVAR